jgi:hypothetical protein
MWNRRVLVWLLLARVYGALFTLSLEQMLLSPRAGVAFAELSLRHSVATLPMGASARRGEGAADGQARVNTRRERPREAVQPAVAHTRNGRSFRHDDAIELFRMQVGEQSTRVCHAMPLARRPVARP